jgi:hypothetical protein
MVESVRNQKDEKQIAPGYSTIKDLSVYGEVGASLRSVADMGGQMRIIKEWVLHRQDEIFGTDRRLTSSWPGRH